MEFCITKSLHIFGVILYYSIGFIVVHYFPRIELRVEYIFVLWKF